MKRASDFSPTPPIEGLDWDQYILLMNGRRFFSRIFVVNGEEKNCLAALFRESPDVPWIFAIRFRYYDPDSGFDPFNDRDRRSGQAYAVPEERKVEIVRFTREMLGLATANNFGGDGKIHEIILETNDPRKISRALQREDFFHTKDAREVLG